MRSDDLPTRSGHGGGDHSARHERSTIRSVLFFGFAAIFALWLVSAYDLVQRVTDAEQRAAARTARFTEGEELLSTVRARVSLSSVYARDAALDTAPDAQAQARESLHRMRSEVEQALQRYAPNVDSAVEREHWTLLQAELRDYWNSLSPLLLGATTGSPADAHAFRRDVIPQRDVVVRISDDIRTLNQDALQEQQQAIAGLHRAVRQRIWWTSGIAVAFGLGAAWLAARYAGRLESRIREQHVQEQQAKRELQRLSAELVHAQEQERRTIARDLHDEIGQALMTVRLDLGTVERSGQLSGGQAQALSEARSTTDLAIRTVRDLSQLLHPPMLDDFGLVVTLDAHVRRFADRTGIRTELVLDRMDGRLPSEAEVCAYRVVQEALTNVAKHAGRGARVSVRLAWTPADVELSVTDSGGDGVDTGLPSSGFGLTGMAERTMLNGGRLAAAGTGDGFTVRLRLPVIPPAPDRPR